MEAVPVKIVPRGFGETHRRDWWWVEPMIVFTVFGSFVVYATWAAFQNAHYTYGPYLSPFYSPELWGDSPHAWFGPKPAWWPAFAPFSPALLILPFPGLFRFTCYYYRGAYYKAFWADPVSCTVGEPRTSYWGEQTFPLILQNVHRYFVYVACLFLLVLSYDVWLALWFANPATGQTEFGIGVGTLVLAVNVVLLSAATRSAATRSVTSSAASRTKSRSRRCATPATTARAPSTAGTCCLPGAASSRSRSRTSTSGCARWASSPT